MDISLNIIGGLLIGISAFGMFFSLHKVLGPSSIVSDILDSSLDNHYWKFLFISGIVTGGYILSSTLDPHFFEYALPRTDTMILSGGFLMGIGLALFDKDHLDFSKDLYSYRTITAITVFVATTSLVLWVLSYLPGGHNACTF